MSPEQKVAFLKRQFWILFACSMGSIAAAQYVITNQDKQLKKAWTGFRIMTDVASLYEQYVPPEILAKGNEMLAFGQIEIKYDDK